MEKVLSRFLRWLRRPSFIVGSPDNPYLLRWYLIPRNRWINIYLHKFCRDDDDRALHDHPWWFISLMVRGEYIEHVDPPLSGFVLWWITRKAPSIAYRKAEHRHRVELTKDTNGRPIPCWTIVMTGPNARTWGFWCPRGFVPWFDFVDQNEHGNIGKGCGD